MKFQQTLARTYLLINIKFNKLIPMGDERKIFFLFEAFKQINNSIKIQGKIGDEKKIDFIEGKIKNSSRPFREMEKRKKILFFLFV